MRRNPDTDQNTERPACGPDAGGRKYLRHGRKPRAGAGYPSAADSDPESDADQAGYGDTAVSRDVQHSAADRYYADAYLEPYVKEHFVSSSE